LIKNGHSKIGGIFKSDDMQGHKRFQGFSNEMKCQNLAIDDDSILWYTTEDLKYFFDGGCDSMIVDRLKNCTAVVCYNDLVAVQLIEVLKRNGRTVPDDMSIVSFDNSSLAEKSLYNLTSVIYPSREIGSKAAEMLLQKIQNPNFSATYKFGASLVKRNSIKNIK
ncbi:MAG: substrate-binding domain-containing protein, partial [Oscillospiraceae bacterium]